MGTRERIVAVDAVEPGKATGSRSFQILFGPHNGCRRATMFVGYVPPGEAPWHYHLYDEIVWIWRGPGRYHLGDEVEPLEDGSAFRITPREVHIVENTSSDRELAILGIFTPAGSPSAAYLTPEISRVLRVRRTSVGARRPAEPVTVTASGMRFAVSSRSSSTRPTSTRARRGRSRTASAPPTRSTSPAGTRTEPSGSSGSSARRRRARASPSCSTASPTRSP